MCFFPDHRPVARPVPSATSSLIFFAHPSTRVGLPWALAKFELRMHFRVNHLFSVQKMVLDVTTCTRYVFTIIFNFIFSFSIFFYIKSFFVSSFPRVAHRTGVCRVAKAKQHRLRNALRDRQTHVHARSVLAQGSARVDVAHGSRAARR